MAVSRHLGRRQLDLLQPILNTAFSVRESKRARRMTIKVVPNRGVEVVVPPRTAPRRVEAFVAANRQWIASAQEALSDDCPQADCELPDQVELPAIGKRWRVVYGPGRSKKVREIHDVLRVPAAREDEASCRRLLRSWLATKGRQQLAPWLDSTARAGGFEYQRAQVRGQKTRWGSCSSTGTISINFCLLFLPPACVQYLFLHELCHTRHLNHSVRFWQLVKRHEPAYKKFEARLNVAWKDVPGWVGLH